MHGFLLWISWQTKPRGLILSLLNLTDLEVLGVKRTLRAGGPRAICPLPPFSTAPTGSSYSWVLNKHPTLIFFEKFSNPPLIKFSIFLGKTWKKMVILLSYPNKEWEIRGNIYLLAVMLIGPVCICAVCYTASPSFRPSLISFWEILQPPWLLGPNLLFVT